MKEIKETITAIMEDTRKFVKSKFFWPVLAVVLVVVLAVVVVVCAGIYSIGSKFNTKDPEINMTTADENAAVNELAYAADYISYCDSVNGTSILRDPDFYKDQQIAVQITISNEDDGDYFAFDSNEIAYIIVDCRTSGSKLLPDDTVTVYGTVKGLQSSTVTTVLGVSKDAEAIVINARYINFDDDATADNGILDYVDTVYAVEDTDYGFSSKDASKIVLATESMYGNYDIASVLLVAGDVSRYGFEILDGDYKFNVARMQLGDLPGVSESDILRAIDIGSGVIGQNSDLSMVGAAIREYGIEILDNPNLYLYCDYDIADALYGLGDLGDISESDRLKAAMIIADASNDDDDFYFDDDYIQGFKNIIKTVGTEVLDDPYIKNYCNPGLQKTTLCPDNIAIVQNAAASAGTNISQYEALRAIYIAKQKYGCGNLEVVGKIIGERGIQVLDAAVTFKSHYNELTSEPNNNDGSSSNDEWEYNDISSSDDEWEYNYIPPSVERKLTESDITGLSKEDLRIMKNEIYAIHGYIFNSEDLRSYFNSQIWYKPEVNAEDFDDSVFSRIEKYNVDFLNAAINNMQ